MNYSISFTEICFSPETSTLLQKIINNSYDISDMNQNLTDRMASLPVLNPKVTR